LRLRGESMVSVGACVRACNSARPLYLDPNMVEGLGIDFAEG
jgi:hypothetical protein